ncbi:MAG: hypothetical protein KOO61_09695 [Spirochaetales bacterium]|nr:hypothetical protein [Spirochaetales bacterium]
MESEVKPILYDLPHSILLNQIFAGEIAKTVPSGRAIPFDFTSPPARPAELSRRWREIKVFRAPMGKFFP